MIRDAGGVVRLDAAVTAILGEHKAEGVVLAGGERIAADVVVSAVPPQALDPLLPPCWARAARRPSWRCRAAWPTASRAPCGAGRRAAAGSGRRRSRAHSPMLAYYGP